MQQMQSNEVITDRTANLSKIVLCFLNTGLGAAVGYRPLIIKTTGTWFTIGMTYNIS